MKLRLILFLISVTSLLGTPENSYSILNTYYPEHSCLDGNAVYLAMIYSRLTEMHHACAIVGYKYYKGSGADRVMGKDCIVIYKIAGRIYAIDNRTMHPVEVPYANAQSAIEFYWSTALAEQFIEVHQLGFRTNDYWYN